MADLQWQKVKDIFNAAMLQKPAERLNFVRDICDGDKTLFIEVESLLSSLDDAESFMETPAVGDIADSFVEGNSLKEGICFGHYEIIKQIGSGGMGEVYLAKDKKLDRKVAVKILNEKFASHESNLQRFVREAKAASSLNHPNILVIHEIGEADKAHYIISEFVEGKTLREVFKEKNLKLKEVLDISIQIANALSAAHEAHLIHRDIKPENIMIRPDGYIKILDFGLAKLIEKKKSFIDSEDKNAKQNQTAKGVIMGTVNYMSPEQAKGGKTDERTDIFSLGVVIYEMIAGRTPFAGDSMSETFANLINREPQPLGHFDANVPDELQKIVDKMLYKNKDERYKTIKNLLADLKYLRENSTFDERLEKSSASNEPTTAISRHENHSTVEKHVAIDTNWTNRITGEKKSGKRLLLWSVSALVLIGFMITIPRFLSVFFDAKDDNALNFELMRQNRLTQSGDVYAPHISPDGQYLAYMKIDGAKNGLQMRQIATGQVLELLPMRPGVSFWALKFSPDSNYLYYVEHRETDSGVLYRVPSFGGQPQRIIDFLSGLTIAPDGTRLAFKRIDKRAGVTSIITVNNDGSNERVIAEVDANSDYHTLDWSPDGDSIAYVVRHQTANGRSWYVAEIPAGGGAERRISEPRNSLMIAARWLPDKKGLIVNAVDAKTKLSQIYYLSYPDGAERRITNDLHDYKDFSMTADGKSIVSQITEQDRHIWVLPGDEPRQARQMTFKKEQHFDAVSWLTNDTLVFDIDENGSYRNHDIWRLKIGESEPQPLTTGANDNALPVVSPDGNTIAFVSNRSGKRQIWRMNADGTQPTQITDLNCPVFYLQFSPDGQTIYFQCGAGGEIRLMRVSIDGGEAILVSDSDIIHWAISPDGKKLAYSLLDLDKQKYVTRIRQLDKDRTEKVLDIDPASYLQWSKDGQALYFNLAVDDSKNIWRQSFSETKPQQITDFDKEKIFRFASSPDGKYLACIRFTINYDAVMLKFD